MLTKYHSRKAKKIQGLSLKKYKKMGENNIEKTKMIVKCICDIMEVIRQAIGLVSIQS